MFLEGQIIEFLDNDRLKVGYVRKQEHDRLQVVDPRGKHISIGGDRVVVVHQKTSEDGFPGQARELSEKVLTRQNEMDIQLLWESLDGDRREFTSAELAALFFSESSPEAASAVFRTLSEDTLFFRRKGIQFLPRTADQVETERLRREREQDHEQAREHLVESLRALVNGKMSEKNGDIAAQETLPDTATLLDRIQHWMQNKNGDAIGSLLEEMAGPTRAQEVAYDILLRAGRIDPRRDRILVLAGISEEFPVEVQAAATALAPYRYEDGHPRMDYRNASAFTIDDDDTQEIDDAISVRCEGDGFIVGIHIADVSAFVGKGDRLNSDASIRSSTIYLPSGAVRMFPELLSTDLASLRQGEDRPTVTVEVQFDSAFNRMGYRILLSAIRVTRRFSYGEADAILNSDNDSGHADLKTLHAIAVHLQRDRASRGAITLRRAELQIHVDDSGIHIGKLDPDSPSRLLVSEMMILCNGLTANFASTGKLPVIYRTQEPRESSAPVEANNAGSMNPIEFEKLRKTFKRSRLSLTPGIHSGLGLGAYTQSSSPIRRYADLVTQQQLTAFLQEKPLPYTQEELTRILAGAETSEQEIRGIEDRSTNYWILEYLSREKMAEPMNAFILDRKGNVELEDCYLRGKLQGPAGEEPGIRISVTIDTIHPGRGEIRFKRA